MVSGVTQQGTGSVSVHFRTDIEGLRAIAILLVVLYHAELPGFSGGFVGVDVFFVLSGYLITWLLVKEAEETGTISLLKFYSRRARRLLPAMALMLAITVPLGAVLLAPIEQRIYANSAISTAAYLSNVYFAKESTNYLGTDSENNPFLHTWSLSVEEQFYFFWPIFVMFSLGVFTRGQKGLSRKKLICSMAVVTILSFLASVYLTATHQPWAFFMSPARAWEFAIGALAVLIPQQERPWLRHAEKGAGWLGLVGILIVAIAYSKETSFPGVSALFPVLATVLILRSGTQNKNSGISKILCCKPFQEIGRLSYSWYLWHWPVLVFAAAIKPELSMLDRLWLLLLSLVIAEGSYRFFENPIRHHRGLSKKTAFSLAMAVVITISTVGASFSWRTFAIQWENLPEYARFTHARKDRPEISRENCHAAVPGVEIDADKCTFGGPDAQRTMVLFGDSHAAQWSPAINEIVKRDDEWRFLAMTKSGCATIDIPIYNKMIKRDYTECLDWQGNAFSEIEKIYPDIVFYSISSHYPVPSDKFVSKVEETILKLSNISKKIVIISDTPSFDKDPIIVTQRNEWQRQFFNLDRNLTLNSVTPDFLNEHQSEVAGKNDNVFVINFNDEICPNSSCSFEHHDGSITYSDDDHITASFSKKLSWSLEKRLNTILTVN